MTYVPCKIASPANLRSLQAWTGAQAGEGPVSIARACLAAMYISGLAWLQEYPPPPHPVQSEERFASQVP